METIYLTKEQLKIGLTLKLNRGDVVRVVEWVNKNGTDVLFRAPVRGMYKLKGDIPQYES